VQAAAGKAIAAKNEDLSRTNASLAEAKVLAETNERVATQRANDVLSLSAVQELKELVEAADALWPAFSDKIAAYDEWLAKAKVLIEGNAGHPGVADHEAKLAEIRLRATAPRPAAWEFEDPK